MPIGGGKAIKLNAQLVKGGSIDTFAISPDNTQVVYRADQDTDEMFELYSVQSTGGTPRKLNPPLVAGGNVLDTIVSLGPESGTARSADHFTITPDSQSVVYTADQTVDEHFALYRVPLAGGTAVRLSPETEENGYSFNYQISPDGQWVTFYFRGKLYQVSITGEPAAKALPRIGNLIPSMVSPNGRWALYAEYQPGDSQSAIAIYAVPFDGGAPIKLSGTMTSGGGIYPVMITPDSNGVVYRADQQTDEVWELFATTQVFDK